MANDNDLIVSNLDLSAMHENAEEHIRRWESVKEVVDEALEDHRTGHRLGFDPYKKADPLLAKRHRKAAKVRQQLRLELEYDPCECCELPVNAQPFPLCGGLSALGELGPGFPMYYWNVKYIFVLFFLGLCVVGIPCVLDNVLSGNSSEWNNESGLVLGLSVAGQGTEETLPLPQSWLNICYMVLVLLSYHI